jgi:hypothetical protein
VKGDEAPVQEFETEDTDILDTAERLSEFR